MEEQNIQAQIRKVSLKDETFTDKAAVWGRIVHHMDLRDRRQRIHSYWRIAASVAAVICIAIGLGARVDIASGGKTLQYILPDGSQVELAEHSSVRYNHITWMFARRVVLDGDASFDVTKHKGKFSVVADKGTITVLGTRFSVSQQNDNLHVACTEGSVKVRTKAGTPVLHKGEQLNYDGEHLEVEPILPEYLEFNNAPLSDMITKIEEIYDLTVMNKDICNGLFFSGWVSTQNRDEALEVIMGSCGLGYDLDGNILTIKH